ncbi:MAG: hypothetical protein FD147_2114 [Chloroflexi bacterium]|nr:MAG: hypothetical protein FD147_2114 [Chloroflexota bacterium]
MTSDSKTSMKLNLTRFPSIVLMVLAALLTYAVLMMLPVPAVVGLFVRYDLILLSIITLPVLFLVFRAKGRFGTLVALGLTLVLFALPVSGLWRSGGSEPFIIGGLLPFSDAASYYSDAQRVVEGYRFSAFSARRPLFPALLTVLLAVTGQNLLVSIGVLCAVIAIACYIASREMQRSFGTLPAVVFLFTLFLFYRRIAGTTMTENLGLPLGVSAFVVLWSAAKTKKLWLTAAGLLLLTLALNARAGAFFILPALILWAGFCFRGKRRFSISAFAVTSCAVALGFMLNMLVFKLIADPGGMVFSNFSYTLYGVVAGGKGWMQILIDHPELGQLDDVARSARTYELVFESWKAQPFGLVIGAIRNWFDYLMPRGAGAFGFIRGDQAGWVNYAVRSLLSILAGWGLVTAWRFRKSEPYALMLWAAAGIFLSIPFVPPNDSNQMRVYAATVVFLTGFCVMGLKAVLGLAFRKTTQSLQFPEINAKPALVFGFGLAALAIIGALVVKAAAKPEALPMAECPPGQTQFISHFTPGTLVRVTTTGQDPISGQLNVPIDFFGSVSEGYAEMHAALVSAVEGLGGEAVLARPLDLISMEYPLLIIPADVVSREPVLLNICAQKSPDAELSLRGYWQASSVTALENP